ncbi:hypothetical protein WMY93_009102 [Mugilogobius chulae]|uniref:catechol O-methyltransferase n=1 Tax=Mugilogobius chulae TaxID=88201 RepID=A0AAW0PJQ6_9GOBI
MMYGITGPEEHLFVTLTSSRAQVQKSRQPLALPPTVKMWLLAASASLIPVVLFFSKRYYEKVASLCRRAQAWTLWAVRKEHVPVSRHRRKDWCSVGRGGEAGAALMVLELGMHCGYNSVRMLRLLPPGGRLITVEQDSQTADYGEELILVAGFKHHQFEVIISSSREAIPLLPGRVGSHQDGFSLYLADLMSLEREGLLRSEGCSVVLICRERGAGGGIREYVRGRGQYCIRRDTQAVMELCYQKGTMMDGK